MSTFAWVVCAAALVATAHAHGAGYRLVDDMMVREDKFHVQRNGKFDITTAWNSIPAEQWNGNVVPYVLDASLTGKLKADTQNAIAIINAQTCIKLTENAAATQKITIRSSGDGCVANVGKSPSATGPMVNVSSGCHTMQMVHELCHALGLYHTQQRPDRNRFISVIAGASTDEAQYTADASATDFAIGAYDYRSIMHYGPTDFAKDKTKPVMITPAPTGTQVSLSTDDIAELNFIFLGCPAAGTKAIMCMSSYPFTQSYPSVPKVTVGNSIDIMMNVNIGPEPLTNRNVVVTYTAVAGVTVSPTASGATVNGPTAVKLTFTPTAAQAGTIVEFPISFASNGLNTSCTQSIWVLPAVTSATKGAATVECFGILPGDSTVCSGHGTCSAMDTCTCSPQYFGSSCSKTTAEGASTATFLITEINRNQGFAAGTTGSNTYTQAYSVAESIANPTGTRDIYVYQVDMYLKLDAAATYTFQFLDSNNIIIGESFGTNANAGEGVFEFPTETMRVPRTGSIKLVCTGCYWHTSNVDQQRKFALKGSILCNDGYYGAQCAGVCPGGASHNQCNKNGLCNDGVTGTGTCNCWAGNGTACALASTTPTSPAGNPVAPTQPQAGATPSVPTVAPVAPVAPVTPTTPTAPTVVGTTTGSVPSSVVSTITARVTFIINGVVGTFTSVPQQNFRAAIAQSLGVSISDVTIIEITEITTAKKFTSAASALRVVVSTLAPSSSFPTTSSVVARLNSQVKANSGAFGGVSVSSVSDPASDSARMVVPSLLLAIVAILAAVASSMF